MYTITIITTIIIMIMIYFYNIKKNNKAGVLFFIPDAYEKINNSSLGIIETVKLKLAINNSKLLPGSGISYIVDKKSIYLYKENPPYIAVHELTHVITAQKGHGVEFVKNYNKLHRIKPNHQ